jgi:amidase
LFTVHAAQELDAQSALVGRPLGEDDVEPFTWGLVDAGRSVSGAEVLRLLREQQVVARRITAWWAEGFDLLLTPTVAEPAPLIGVIKQGYTAGRVSVFTRAFNATGQPALSLPLGWPADGLPRGVQFVAAYGREDVLVRIGSQLEAANPWSARQPPTHA